MNTTHLAYLRSVVAEGSFTRAAQRHGVTQAAISLAMRALEGRLGFPLFEREGRRMVPTERARSVASASEDVAEAIRRLPSANARATAGAGDRSAFRAGLAPAAGVLYGTDIYRALHDAESDRVLSVVTGPAPTMLERLQRGELDLVIAPHPRRFALRALRRHVLYLATPTIHARIGHPLQHARTLAEVANAGWVVAGAAGTPGNVIEEAFRVRRWAPPRIEVQCPDHRMLLRFVAGTDLLGVIPNASLVSGDERTVVQALSLRERLPYYEVCLFWRRSHESDRVAETVARSLCRHGRGANNG